MTHKILSFNFSTPREDRLVGSILTQALGDALGFLVEGHHPTICASYTREAFKSSEPPSFFERDFGQYSDDTQLARELLAVLQSGWSPEAFGNRIAHLFETNTIVGRGRATEAAAMRILSGIGWEHAGEPSPSAGNGAAMRAGPVGLFFSDSTARRKVADEQARVTHLDKRSRAAAILVAEVVADALTQPVGSQKAVGTPAWCENIASSVVELDPHLAAAIQKLPSWLSGPESIADREIALVGDVPLGSAHQFEKWHGISPFATPSALYAVYAYGKTPTDAEQVLNRAVAVGGDVDTVAAMAGAMVGARVGWSGLSDRLQSWAARLHDQGHAKATVLAELVINCGRFYDHKEEVVRMNAG